MVKNWIAFFSISGKTFADVCEKIEHNPSCAYTDNPGIVDSRIVQQFKLYRLPHDKIMNIFRQQDFTDHLILLMGYLKIIPYDICEKYSIYNIHPANIIACPEYKGKDPIERIFADNKQHKALGVVLHRVIPEVDGGEILFHQSYTANTIDDARNKVNEIAVDMWCALLKRELI